MSAISDAAHILRDRIIFIYGDNESGAACLPEPIGYLGRRLDGIVASADDPAEQKAIRPQTYPRAPWLPIRDHCQRCALDIAFPLTRKCWPSAAEEMRFRIKICRQNTVLDQEYGAQGELVLLLFGYE